MQPDYAELTFKLLASNTEHRVAGAPFRVSASARSVNCLWITSLVFSLSTSLVGILVKQWLADYDTMVQEESMVSCVMRQNRYDNLVRWRLPEIVSWLPVLLHASLFLFLAGLVIFLFPLDPSTASLGLVLTILVSSSYSAATLLPIIWVDSPYATPVTSQLARLFAYCRTLYPDSWPRALSRFDHVKSLARAFEWLINTAPSTVSGKIRTEVQKVLSDRWDGPDLCHRLPHIVQMATDRLHMQLRAVEDYGTVDLADIASDLDIAFRLAFNQAEFSYRSGGSLSLRWNTLIDWYSFNRADDSDIESPANIVALCYLRERSTHEAFYHHLEVPLLEAPKDLLQKLPVSSQTVLVVAKYLTRKPENSSRIIEQGSAEYRATLRGLNTVLDVLCAWRTLFDWDEPVVAKLLSSWMPREAHRDWRPLDDLIPALCRVFFSRWDSFMPSSSWSTRQDRYYDPSSLIELLQHICLARFHSPDVPRLQYSEIVDVLGSDGRAVGPFDNVFCSRFVWTVEQVEAFLDAALIDPSNATCAQMVRNVLGLDVCINAPRVRDRCAHIVLKLLEAHHSLSNVPVVQMLLDSRALAMLRDHTRITELVVALFETLIRRWHYPKLDACFDLDDVIPAGGRCTPNVIATAIRQRYSDDRASELRDICGMVISLAEWGCFEGSGKAIVDIVWKDLIRDEVSAILQWIPNSKLY